MRIAIFISSHGFGHAARATAIAEALSKRIPNLQFDLLTAVPEWFFKSAHIQFDYHYLDCDPGLKQTNPFDVDLQGSAYALNRLLPFDQIQIKTIAKRLNERRCRLILCDVAVFGIAVAKIARLPSVLVENFTWDWIYHALSPRLPILGHYADILAPLIPQADLHIQTQPVCSPDSRALTVPPVSREPRTERQTTRERLGIDAKKHLIFITLGGVAHDHPYLQHLIDQPGPYYFLVAGAESANRIAHNVHILPAQSTYFHPDLVHSADLVIGKAGYSTLSEVFHAGTRFAYFCRQNNPEMAALVTFLNHTVPGVELDMKTYAHACWLQQLPDLLSLPQADRTGINNGAEPTADAISSLLQHR